MSVDYVHVDVFSGAAYGGNSLSVFPDARGLDGRQMLAITRELRHFESIFIEPTGQPNRVRARVFDLLEELPFAGHPLLGAAAVLHSSMPQVPGASWHFCLPRRAVVVETQRTGSGYFGLLQQGSAEFLGVVHDREPFAHAFGLQAEDLIPELPLEIVSTGLRYLIVAVRSGVLERAKIRRDISAALRSAGAQFAVLLDEAALEIRHWNNDGIIEDVATGSAAGAIGAFRLRHRLQNPGEIFAVHQGRFVGRPSVLQVRASGSPESVTSVQVGGDISMVGRGALDVLP